MAGAAAVAAAGLLALGIAGNGMRELGPFDSTDESNLGLVCNTDVNVLIAIPILQGDDSGQFCVNNDDDSHRSLESSSGPDTIS